MIIDQESENVLHQMHSRNNLGRRNYQLINTLFSLKKYKLEMAMNVHILEQRIFINFSDVSDRRGGGNRRWVFVSAKFQ